MSEYNLLRAKIREEVENSALFTRMRGTGLSHYDTRLGQDRQEVVLTIYEGTIGGQVRISDPTKYGLSDLSELKGVVQTEFSEMFPDAQKGIPKHIGRRF